jgi:putative GTP pyrophosphokinase
MALASEILARAFEDSKGPCPQKDNIELVRDFLTFDEELRLLNTLHFLSSADTIVSDNVSKNRNSILIFSQSGELEIRTYRDATEALRELFKLEKEHPGQDIVLVKVDTSEEVRVAFKNYFSDAKDVISLVERGCQILSGVDMIEKTDLLKALEMK